VQEALVIEPWRRRLLVVFSEWTPGYAAVGVLEAIEFADLGA
jgi:hypothetical protein